MPANVYARPWVCNALNEPLPIAAADKAAFVGANPTPPQDSLKLSTIAWRPVIAIAAAKVAFQLATSDLYGAHRDEFYYLAGGHHLAFGYVDHPPIVPVLYRLSEILFGHTVPAMHVLPGSSWRCLHHPRRGANEGVR